MAPFDLQALFAALDEARRARGFSWAALARDVGSVSASTIRRLETASDCEADGMLELCRWLDEPPERFVTRATAGEPLPNRSKTGVVRVQGSRTTAQRLCERALKEGVSIASLTRLSPV